MLNPSDFASVQWGRKLATLSQNFTTLSPDELRKLSQFLNQWANIRENGAELTPQQINIILQNLRLKDLVKLEVQKGGIYVELTGGGFEYERFLLRDDGRMPNGRYEAKKS
jgi:hypothetical protein